MIFMCGRFALHNPITEVSESIGATDLEVIQFEPSYNIGPQQEAPVIVKQELTSSDSLTSIRMMKWGLRPSWSKKVLKNQLTPELRVLNQSQCSLKHTQDAGV